MMPSDAGSNENLVKRKNILISALALKVGGGEVMAMTLAAGLAKDYNVYLFYHLEQQVNKALVQRLLPSGVTLISTNSFPLINFLAWKLNALLNFFAPQIHFHDYFRSKVLLYFIKKHKIKVVSSHSKYADLACARIIKKARIPLVVTEHGEYAQAVQLNHHTELNVLRKADALVAVSDYNKHILYESGCELPPVFTIYNGVVVNEQHSDIAARQKLGINEDVFVFGMVSRGVKEKGWQEAIDAFLHVAQKAGENICLILVGDSSYMQSLKEKYKHEAAIFFVGAVADPAFYISAFDVGLLPTQFKTESLPLCIIEYLFFGKPVIATNVGGIPEILAQKDKPAGLLVALDADGKTSINELSLCMMQYMQDSELYKTHATNAFVIKEQFRIAACVEKYKAVFEKFTHSSAI